MDRACSVTAAESAPSVQLMAVEEVVRVLREMLRPEEREEEAVLEEGAQRS